MKSLEEIKNILSIHKPEFQKKYHIKNIGIFGSYIRNEQNSDSDLDLLVDFEETPTLIKFINFENSLSDLLEIKVDLVMKKALKPNIGKIVLDEAVFL